MIIFISMRNVHFDVITHAHPANYMSSLSRYRLVVPSFVPGIFVIGQDRWALACKYKMEVFAYSFFE